MNYSKEAYFKAIKNAGEKSLDIEIKGVENILRANREGNMTSAGIPPLLFKFDEAHDLAPEFFRIVHRDLRSLKKEQESDKGRGIS